MVKACFVHLLAGVTVLVLGMAALPAMADVIQDLSVTGEFGVGPNVGKDHPLQAPIDIYWDELARKLHVRSLILTEIADPVDLRLRRVPGTYPDGPIGPLPAPAGDVPGIITWDTLTPDGFRPFAGIEGVGGDAANHPAPTGASHPGWLTFFTYPENSNDRMRRVIIDHTGSMSIGGGGYGADGLPAPSHGLHVFGGGLRLQAVQPPPAPRLSVVGQSGTTSYTYQIIARDSKGNQSPPSAPAQINGPSVLNSSNYVEVRFERTYGGETFWILRNGQRLNLEYRAEGTEKLFNDTGYSTVAYAEPVRNKTADAEIDGSVIAKQGIVTPGVLAVPQITVNQHNYSPTGLASSATVALSAAVPATITGLQAPATDGRWLLLVNTGSAPITLANESSQSDAPNRFRTGTGAGFILQPNQMTQTVYSLGRWQFLAVPH